MKDSIIKIVIIIVINFHIIIIFILIIIVMVHAPHGRYINAGNLSPITRSQQAASRDLGRISLLIAFSRRSDNGVRREGREREKNKEEKRERGGTLTPTPPPRFCCCFFFFFSHLFVVSPRSERLEQATLLIPERLFFEVRPTLSQHLCF